MIPGVIELATVPAGLWAVVGTLIGTIGLKVAEKYLNRSQSKREQHRDYRTEIQELQDRLDKVEEEVTFWRNRFNEEQEDNAVLRQIIINAGGVPPTKRIVGAGE